MASIQAFGDIHGRSDWKMFIDTQFDYIVFVGDYFDNEKIDGHIQISNFLEIIEFKKKFPNKLKLLIGNHDLQYLSGIDELCTGWQENLDSAINKILEENLKYLQPSFTFNNILFTHAGLTKSFSKRVGLNLRYIDKSLQTLFDKNRQAFQLFGDSINGDTVEQSPCWVRPGPLLNDKLDGINQVVGHTKQETIQLINGCAFIDIQGMPMEILNCATFDWDNIYSF
ncbi:metallophosphoesterase [Sphingobacterium lactis]|uniref:metallophosphoesterase n=1 Tax=Sphingobacterium lactis TaxID=797291 RepID=UPI003F813B09